MAMTSVTAFDRPLSAMLDLLRPALWSLKGYAPSVKRAELMQNFADDTIELAVVHTLFDRREIQDETYKTSFQSRVARMLCADGVPNGRQLTVERRSFLARAARIRKTKPTKARSR